MDMKIYAIDPGPEWDAINDGDGYDLMHHVSDHGWVAIPSWGIDGWDLGSWPYMIVFAKNVKKDGQMQFLLSVYAEGDLDVYSFKTNSERQEAIADIAIRQWTRDQEPWMNEFNMEDLRKPYHQ